VPPEEQTLTDFEMHAPDLYDHAAVGVPLDSLSSIGEEEIALYHSQGFLAVRNAFSAEEMTDAIEGWEALIRGDNPDFNGFDYEPNVKDRIESLTLEEKRVSIRKLMFFVNFDPRLKAMSDHPALLNVVSRLIGGAPPRMFQDMALSKPPNFGREKPWHQDCSYFDIPANTPVVGVWIAMDEATLENGCMHMLGGRHQEGPIVHFQRRDWQICDDEVYKIRGETHPVVAVPLPPGGCLFFGGLTPHGTATNVSSQPRRALQFHYYPEGTQRTSTEERLAVFGSEGKDVSC
jgi:phytanoyl-CoA hydroxylase